MDRELQVLLRQIVDIQVVNESYVADKGWRSILDRVGATPSELRELLGTSAPKLRGQLVRLKNRGLVRYTEPGQFGPAEWEATAEGKAAAAECARCDGDRMVERDPGNPYDQKLLRCPSCNAPSAED